MITKKIEVWGDYALFTRPEMKVERVSYDVMTPSAARGIMEAIYWHPGVKWHIDRIHVCNPIKFTNVRRNEIKHKISGRNLKQLMSKGTGTDCIYAGNSINQRASIILKDVRYVIEAHFSLHNMEKNDVDYGKVNGIVDKRISKGSCFYQPYFGCKEFTANFKEFTDDMPSICDDLRSKSVDLGYMLYDLNYDNIARKTPMFFRAQMNNGTIDIANCEVCR